MITSKTYAAWKSPPWMEMDPSLWCGINRLNDAHKDITFCIQPMRLYLPKEEKGQVKLHVDKRDLPDIDDETEDETDIEWVEVELL